MNVSLGSKWEQFVEDKVASGDYQTASEVLREGLRRLEREELLRRISVQSLPELEEKLHQAAESLNNGEGVDAATAFKKLRAKQKARRNGQR